MSKIISDVKPIIGFYLRRELLVPTKKVCEEFMKPVVHNTLDCMALQTGQNVGCNIATFRVSPIGMTKMV